MQFGAELCECGLHKWSEVAPGTIHVISDRLEIVGITWAQIGSRRCLRPGCTAVRSTVREGIYSGYDKLITMRQALGLEHRERFRHHRLARCHKNYIVTKQLAV